MFETEELLQPPPEIDEGPPMQVPLTTASGSIDARATLDRLLDTQPGPDVLSVASTLSSVQSLLTSDERVDLTVVLERCTSWVEAVKQPVFAGLRRDAGERTRNDDEPGRFEDVVLELGLALRWSEWMVSDRLDVAAEIDTRLPATWRALAEGRINYWQAHKVAEATQKLDDDEAAARLEKKVLAKAPELTRAETGRLVDRELIKADPEAAEKRRKNARGFRKVARSRAEDGMANLQVHGPAEDIAVMDIALDRGAEQLVATGQVENQDQGRFDTLLSWATDYLKSPFLPGRSARPATVSLIVKRSTANGEDNDPAELERWGPVTASVARDLINGVPARPGPFDPAFTREEREAMGRRYKQLFPDAEKYADDDPDPPPPDSDCETGPPDGHGPNDWDAPDQWPPSSGPPERGPLVTFQMLRIDPQSGGLLPPPGVRVDFGNEREFLTGRARQFVLDRFRTCVLPTCAMPARCCDVDHWKERARGGRTDGSTNSGPGCPHHNRTTRNRPGWEIEPNGDGTATLITPQGRRYPITPFDYREL